ncbi:MAG: hypothetical protein V7682_02295 [Cycloclasticus sp.]
MYENINPNDISSINAHEVLAGIDVTEFIAMLDAPNGVLNRQSFCKFLGIRESTLSGWLKEKKLPHYAQMAFGLLIMLRKSKSTTDEKRKFVVTKLSTDWGIVQLETLASGEIQGKMIAGNIESESMAKQLLGSIGQSSRFLRGREVAMEFFAEGTSVLWDAYEAVSSPGSSKEDDLYKEENEGVEYLITEFASYMNACGKDVCLDNFTLDTLILLAWKSKNYLTDEQISRVVDEAIERAPQCIKGQSYIELAMLLQDKLLPIFPSQEERLNQVLSEQITEFIGVEKLEEVWDILKLGLQGIDLKGNSTILDRESISHQLIRLSSVQKDMLKPLLIQRCKTHRKDISEGKVLFSEFVPVGNLSFLYLSDEERKEFNL